MVANNRITNNFSHIICGVIFPILGYIRSNREIKTTTIVTSQSFTNACPAFPWQAFFITKTEPRGLGNF